MNISKGYKTNFSRLFFWLLLHSSKLHPSLVVSKNVLLFQKPFHESHKQCRGEGEDTKEAEIDEEKLWHCYFHTFVLLKDDKRWRIVLKISGARHHHKPTV